MEEIKKQIITEQTAINMVEKHNKRINDYLNEVLPDELGLDPEQTQITLDLWLQAQGLIQKQGFYKDGLAICKFLRDCGYDVKINAQTEELKYFGKI